MGGSGFRLRDHVFFLLAMAVRSSIAGIGDALSAVPFYHTGAQIHDSLAQLAQNCAGASMTVEQRTAGANSSVPIDVITVRGRSAGSFLQRSRGSTAAQQKAKLHARMDGPLKVMLVFGEHARELISAESGLHFLRAICNGGGADGQNTSSLIQTSAAAASSTLDYAEFKVVVNANPMGRAYVESGDFCHRTNEDGVDLNRNWGEHFDPYVSDKDKRETNPGPAGFSEPETQVLRDVASEYSPTVFLTVHSGALILATPHGYDKSTPDIDSESKMTSVLGPISEKYCACPFGGLSKLLGYQAPGNAIDYAYDDLGVPYTFTWEIYANQELQNYYHWIRTSEKKEQQDQSDAAQSPWSSGGVSMLQSTKAQLLQEAQRLQAKQLSMEGNCFQSFNPGTEAEYNDVLNKWTSAYVDLVAGVAKATGVIM